MPTTGTVGAISELVVSTDLMAAGYHVCRALSPSCPFDLVVANDEGRLCRVEVRTGSYRPNGKLSFGFAAREFEARRFDVLAVVVPGGVVYEPSVADYFAGKTTTVKALHALRHDPRALKVAS